jgi:hypothetical protein
MHPTIHSMMVSCGAPEYMLRTAPEIRRFLPSMHEKLKPITSATQTSWYQRALKQPFGAWLMVVGSKSDEDLSIAAALQIMQAAVICSLKEPQKYCRPRFWPVYGGNFDRLRQNPEFRENIGRLGMLILSNIAENSSHEKIEKVRDLVTMHRNVPCIVTVVGCDPLGFASEKLHMKPDRVLHLGRKKAVSI